MKVLDARWFRVLAIFVLLLVLLGLNLNRLIVLIDKRYYEPTYRGCITVMGWIAEDVTQLERQIVCNITMVKIIADAERALAAEASASDEQEPSAQLGRPSGTKSLQRDLDDRRQQRAFSATWTTVGNKEPSAQLGQ
jgi:hypothetical protein